MKSHFRVAIGFFMASALTSCGAPEATSIPNQNIDAEQELIHTTTAVEFAPKTDENVKCVALIRTSGPVALACWKKGQPQPAASPSL